MDSLDALRAQLTDLVGPACKPLHEVLENSFERSNEHLSTHEVPRHHGNLARLVRMHLAAMLAEGGLPGLNLQQPLHGGRLQLAASDGSTIRLLHGPKGYVPPPGRNQARISYYMQSLPIPGLEPGHSFLGLWSFDDEGVAHVRVVRPIGRWRFGQHAQIDLDVTLPRLGAELPDLEFQPDDSGFEILLPDYEYEEARTHERHD